MRAERKIVLIIFSAPLIGTRGVYSETIQCAQKQNNTMREKRAENFHTPPGYIDQNMRNL